MAGENDKIILSVDTNQMQKDVADATAKLVLMKNQLAILDDAMKKGNITVEDYAKKSSVLKGEIQATTQQQNANIKILNQVTQHNKAAAGSVDALKAELVILTAQYNALSKEERENTEHGKALTAETKRLKEELNAAGAEILRFEGNVGNYTGGILQAVDGTGLLATVTENLEGAQKAYNATLNIMKSSLAGNVSMLKVFKLALAATGIGAVVLVLGGLISFLTRTQEGIDFVSRSTKGFTTVLGFLSDRLSDVGEKVFNAFSNPKQALLDLVDLIETNLLNRVKSFAVILEAIQKRDFVKLNDGILQLATGITDASGKTKAFAKELADVAASGAAVEGEFQRIREAERALNVERSKSRAEIERLKFLSEDTNKTEKERIAAAEKAYALEQSFLNRAVKLQNDKVENIKLEMSLTKATAADRDKLAEEEQKANELREESFGRQTELNNKINELRAQGLIKQAAVVKEGLEIQKELIAMELEQATEGSLEQLKLRQDLVNKQLEIENSGAEVSLARRKANEVKANAELLKINQEYFDEMEIKHREFAEKVLGPLTDEDVERQIDATAKRLENQQKLNDAIEASEIELQQTKQDAMGAGLEALKVFFGEQSAAAKAFYLGQKAIAIADIITNLQVEIAGIAKANSVFGPAGIPLTIAQSLAAKIRAGIGIATIAAQTVQEFKMAEGGVIDGPSHAAGGVKGTGRFSNVEVEGGEAVINKRSTSQYKDILSAINVAGGGKPLTLNRFMAAGGLTAAPAPVFPMMGRNAGTDIDYSRLAREMSKVKIVTVVSEVRAGINKAEIKQSKTDI